MLKSVKCIENKFALNISACLLPQLSASKSEYDRNVAQWCIDALNVREDYYQDLTADVLNLYAGTYGRFKIYVKDDSLYMSDFIGSHISSKVYQQNPIPRR